MVKVQATPKAEPKERKAKRRVKQEAKRLINMTDLELYQSVSNMNAPELRDEVAKLSVLLRNLLIELGK